MKKILAIVLALSMALSLGTAFAAETPKYKTATITLNVNSQLAQMMAGGGDETTDAILSIINKLAIVILEGENGAFELSANLPAGKILSLNGSMNENGCLITTDLLPSYAIQISRDMLEQLMSSATTADGGGQTIDFSVFTEIIKPYTGEPQMGEFTLNGKNYMAKTDVALDGVAVVSLLRALLAMLPAQSVESFPALPSDEEIAEENLLIAYSMYQNITDPADPADTAMECTISQDGIVNQRILIETTSIVATSEYSFAGYLPQNAEFESWEAAVAALNAGEDRGYAITGSITADDPYKMSAAKVDFTLYNGGQYIFGLKLDATETSVDAALSLMSPDMTLFSAKVVIGESDVPAAPVEAGERTVVDLETLTDSSADNSELTAALQKDLQYGSTTLMINLIQFAPEEMTVLMNQGNDQTEEVPAEEVPSDEVPSDEIPVEPAA